VRSSGWGWLVKELLLATDVSATLAEVIFRVKWIVFVSRWCCKSAPLNIIGQFSHDGIGWKTHVKFVISHWLVLIRLLLVKLVGFCFLSYFFVKKCLLVGVSGMLWTGQWMSEWVRDVCMSHQSDWIHYKQPIKFLVVKVNGMWEDLIPTQIRTAIFILLWKRRKYSYIGLTSTFSVG